MPSYDIHESIDVYGPRQAVRQFGATLGFAHTDCLELAIVVSELVSNIVKYGVHGAVRFEAVADQAHGAGILVAARDVGPPFRDLQMALRDGYDDRGPIDPGTILKRGGLGAGLGAELRLTDSFTLESLPQGKEIKVIRYRRRPRRR